MTRRTPRTEPGRPKEVNQGCESDRREAMKAANELSKLIITLSTGSFVVSATFLEKFYNGHDLALLIVSWALIGGSTLLGLLAIGNYVSQLAESDLRPRTTMTEWFALGQWVFFLIGIVLFGIFVVQNVKDLKPAPAKPATTTQASAYMLTA